MDEQHFFLISFWLFKIVLTWVSHDLGYIIDQGDNLMISLWIDHPLAADEFPSSVNVNEYNLEVNMLWYCNNRLNDFYLFADLKDLKQAMVPFLRVLGPL